MTVTHTPASLLRRLLGLALLCLAMAVVGAEVSPARLLLLRGAVAVGEGRAAAAVADLREAALLTPEDWRCQLLYGQALAQVRQTVLMRSQFRRAGVLEPSNPAAWQAIAEAARDLSDPQLELAAAFGALRLFPENPRQLQRLVLLYRALGRKAEAERTEVQWRALLPPIQLDYRFLKGFHAASLEELRDLHAEEPTNRAILYALATEEWRAGHLAETRVCLQLLYTATPDNTELAAGYVHVLLLAGEVDDALAVLRQAAPKGHYALNRALALWSLSLGRPQDAIAPLERLLLRDPIDTAQNRLLGLAQLLTGNRPTAIAACRTAWLRDYDHLSAQLYAEVLQADGNPAEAERVLRKAIALHPTETMLSLQLAKLYRDTGQLDKSADALIAVAKGRPERVELLALAGERYCRAGYVQQAYGTACALRDSYPGDMAAALAAAQLFRRLSARSEARLTLTRYLAPTFPTPLPKADILLCIARDAAADNRLSDATQALSELRTAFPQHRDGYRELGHLYLQQANWPEAIRCYQEALARWPEDGEFTLALARATAQSGNPAQAILLYRQAAARLTTAEPLLELGALYARQRDDARARDCWLAAQERPGGSIRARMSLLASYQASRETTAAAAVTQELRSRLAGERQTRAARWQRLLTAAGYPPTPEEVDALLLLEPDLIDPANLPAQ